MAGLSLPGVQPRFAQQAGQYMGQAAGTYGMLTKKTETEKADPTLGGAISAGAGGAAAGATIATATAKGASAGPWGAAIGAIAGIAAYMLS